MKKIERIISEAVRDAISRHSVTFRLDRISEMTVRADARLHESADGKLSSYILRRKNWEVNNYERFLGIVKNTPPHLKGFLTWHGLDEITQGDWITYTLKGYDVCFALHYLGPGRVDICNLVNNSELKGIGGAVLEFAKQQGGTQMDNYRGIPSQDDPEGHGKLGNLYRSHGFDRQTWRDEFNPEYQPDDPEWRFDTEKFGTPDVEGLERSRHRMRYNNPNSPYRGKWDRRVGSKFKK